MDISEKEKLARNIDRVCEQRLCTECGACWGICPRSNIRIHRAANKEYVFRVIDQESCDRCKLCAEVCPGIEVDFGELQHSLFGDMHADPLFGCVRKSYLTRAADSEVARRGASGGTATTLLEFGLTTGRINGALVAGMSDSTPWEPKVLLAKSVEEVRAAAQSKYCPVPTCTSFHEVIAQEGRFAMVGLPCHIHALRKAQAISQKLRQRIVFAIGLFCGPGPSFLMIDHLLRRRDVGLDEVAVLHYRDKRALDGEWPGGILAETKDGRRICIPMNEYTYAETLFTRRRCAVCADYAAELADVSLGDAHLKELWSGSKTFETESETLIKGPDGWNTMLIRTPQGAEWVQALRAKGAIEVEQISLEKLKDGAARSLYMKKTEFWARLRLRSLIRRSMPHFPGLSGPPQLQLVQYLKPILSTIIGEVVEYRLARWILRHVPESWFQKKIALRQRMIERTLQERCER